MLKLPAQFCERLCCGAPQIIIFGLADQADRQIANTPARAGLAMKRGWNQTRRGNFVPAGII